jgi:hypothetical protein
MKEIKIESEIKIQAIAAASRALRYKDENLMNGDKKIMQRVMNELDEISVSTE